MTPAELGAEPEDLKTNKKELRFMLTLDDVRKKTDKAFEELAAPEPSIHWKNKLEALEEANLDKHRTAAIFDMRCEQAAAMGFEHIVSGDLVEMLMGERHTHFEEHPNRQNYEYAYDHHTDADISNNGWGGCPDDFIRRERNGPWFLPPFAKKEIWRCRFGKLNYLKRAIPYGVVLRINELKPLKLFNAFNVLAPIEAWERQTDIDPIVTATIWEIVKNEKTGKGFSAGQVAHFFLAQW